MKLLILTQKVDLNDPLLGFFHSWLREFAKKFASITVICLEEGTHQLPENVKVVSLGKEKIRGSRFRTFEWPGMKRLGYAARFYRLIWKERKNYDAVFVHMNEEYVILGGLFWRSWGKKIALWRNHAQGTLLTRLAVLLSHKVFCTSPASFTARFAKTSLMPVGIDTDFFAPQAPEALLSKENRHAVRKPRSILFFGRISPVKRVSQFVAALTELKKEEREFEASIVGYASPDDQPYFNAVKEQIAAAGLSSVVALKPGVPPLQSPDLYRAHELYVNLTPAGSLDKTIFEAMACGCLVLLASKPAQAGVPVECILEEAPEGRSDQSGGTSLTSDLARGAARKMSALLDLPAASREPLARGLRGYVESLHSLKKLAADLCSALEGI